MGLKARAKQLFEQSHQIYGSYLIHKKPERERLPYSRSYIALLMKEMGFRSVLKKKFVVTTDSKHVYPVAENILNPDHALELRNEG